MAEKQGKNKKDRRGRTRRGSEAFAEQERVARALEKALGKAERREKRRAAWDVPGERARYVRALKRERRLKKLPPDLKCPGPCGKVKTRQRQWVTVPVLGVEKAMCRSCAISLGHLNNTPGTKRTREQREADRLARDAELAKADPSVDPTRAVKKSLEKPANDLSGGSSVIGRILS